MLLVLLQIFGPLDILEKRCSFAQNSTKFNFAKLVKLTNSSLFNFLRVGLINGCICPNVCSVISSHVCFLFIWSNSWLSVQFYQLCKTGLIDGCRHSSVDSSAPSIMPPRVRLPSTPSMLLSFIVKFVLYLSLCCEKERK